MSVGLGCPDIPVPCIHGFLIRFINSFSIPHSLVLCFLLEHIPAVTGMGMGGGGEGHLTPPDRLPVHRKTFLISCDFDLFLAPLAPSC